MATISRLSLLFFFTLTLFVHARLDLDAADHLAIFTILESLGIVGELHRPENLCNTAGISCEGRISKGSNVLKVTGIVLRTQRLRGFLSPAIGQLSELKVLSLPNNYIVDRIPPQIAGCRKLETLQVRNNRLSGDVPGELSSLLHLRILDLSSNMFSGDLSFLKHFPNLEKISLDNNLFTGKVPVSLCSFRNLRFYNISGNSFLKGRLPAMKRLESLSPDLKKKNYKRIPKRYVLAELTNSSANQMANSPQASSPMESPENKHRKKNRKTTLIAGLTCSIIFLVLLFLIVIKVKRRWNKSGPTIFRTLIKRRWIKRRWNEPSPMIFSPLIKPKELAFLSDHKAIAALQIIGRGGCGEVYKKEIPEGKIKAIAIKVVIQAPKDEGELTEEQTTFQNKKMRQIQSEIKTVGQIRHRNLLPLLAYVPGPKHHYLVYEFMQNGSLQDIMKQVNNGTRELDWLARHNIAVGVASGLEFLHMGLNPRIVHRDLKPANILLNDDMEALITDFGVAKYIPTDLSHMTTSNIVGTYGYIAPEFHQTYRYTDECDIYSFGVFLGILVIGKFPWDEFFQHTSEMSMVRWMNMVITSDNPKQGIHQFLLGNGYEEQMLEVLKIACLCTQIDPQQRPTSKDCRDMLAQINL